MFFMESNCTFEHFNGQFYWLQFMLSFYDFRVLHTKGWGIKFLGQMWIEPETLTVWPSCCHIVERMLNPVYNLRTYTRVKIHEFNYLKTRWNCPKCTQGYIWIWRQLHTCIHAGTKALCNKVQNSKNLNVHSIQHPLSCLTYVVFLVFRPLL